MSANSEDDKDLQKAVPLDLARAQITAVRTVESNKAPLVMTSQALRSVRVLTQNVSSSSNPAGVGQTIITNLVPGAVLKQDAGRALLTGGPQSQNHPQVTGGISIQRPTQITLSATPLVTAQNPTGTTYHVPRGPAVVANLAAPRSNMSTVRSPLVATAQNSQAHSFIRPPRTPSPAQGTAWQLATNSNNPQLKGASTVLSSPVRGATITGKPHGRALPNQAMQTLKPTILSNAIIGQTIHSFKPAPGGTVQIGNTVTLAQMLPARSQAVVYNTNTSTPQFTPATRITVTTTAQGQIRPSGHPRPMGPIVSGARLTVPISQVLAQNSRLVTASSGSLGPNQRISVASISQSQPGLANTTRLVSTQAGNVVGRLAVNNSTIGGAGANSGNILTSQARISALSTLNLQSIMVANGSTARVQSSQGPKIITQPTATIHLAQIPSEIKTSSSGAVTSSTRTINVPASVVAQRPGSGGVPQAIPIAKVYTTSDNQNTPGTASVLIHASLAAQAPRHASPGLQNVVSSGPQQTITSVPSANTPFSLGNQEAGSYYFENASTASGAFQRTFVSQQANSFVAQPQQPNQQIIRPPVSGSNQQFQGVRLSSVMVVEQSRGQQLSTQFQPIATSQAANEHRSNIETTQHHNSQSQMNQNKMNSSPRPSILRKRDHEGSPLKAAKNLIPALQNSNQQVPHPLASPPSPPRPDSRENGHSSGGSTTISATSSPGLPEANDDSNPAVTINEEEESKPPVEMSPRKKPRKQQLTGNDDETHDDMQFISESSAAKKENYDSDGPRSDSTPKDGAPEASVVTTIRKPATASLLNGYRQNWKATHNHYQRYTDVKPKDERRPTIIDLANQNKVLEKVNGWKVYHLSTQMDDLAEQEQGVYDQLTDLLKFTESEENSKPNGREVNRVNELIKGNLQRIKIINDGMQDAKSQIMKVFNHQRHVNDILSRCASKRNFKKREKS